jgi:hypothetical protein
MFLTISKAIMDFTPHFRALREVRDRG